MNSHPDYIENVHNNLPDKLSEDELEQWGKTLFEPDKTIADKKQALAILAHSGKVSAHQHLKKYAENPEQELEEWAKLALGESVLFLRMELGVEDEDFVYTGIGKNNDQLKFCFMILPREEDQHFKNWQNIYIETEANDIARELGCELEWYEAKDDFFMFSILMPTTISVASFIEKVIETCNQMGNFILEDYYCGCEKPDDSETSEIMDIVRGKIPPPEF
ncbi:hypothetical protein [Parabacteroides sp. FAFU027]|uniref:hypothetical protein n=1 Tax=Parabacteroides sp. FAFU027 TaxID=2922715 RepID=UPI001FB01B40|nr:hypothetical protein [Parabacteroides sp. FAFU027]